MENIYKDFDSEEKKAKESLEAAQRHMESIQRMKEQEAKNAKKAIADEKAKLIKDADNFREDSLKAARNGDLTTANNLKSFAEEAEKQAREIVIEGEVIAEPDETHPKFGEGMGLGRILIVLAIIVVGLFLLTDYVNYRVQQSEKSISLSLGAEWIHAINTTMFWVLAWFFTFGLMYVAFRSISKFINPKEHPEFDLTTKLFNECSAQTQIIVSLLLLLSMLFSWVLIFLHNPVSNAG